MVNRNREDWMIVAAGLAKRRSDANRERNIREWEAEWRAEQDRREQRIAKEGEALTRTRRGRRTLRRISAEIERAISKGEHRITVNVRRSEERAIALQRYLESLGYHVGRFGNPRITVLTVYWSGE
ncbi:MAG: hypothetical protein M0Q70_14025 [Dokdonella sp.]|nr:hypothetical protein [Dokdonella sp.]